jgi:hypothetical protein
VKSRAGEDMHSLPIFDLSHDLSLLAVLDQPTMKAISTKDPVEAESLKEAAYLSNGEKAVEALVI